MIDPIQNGANLFLGIFNALPQPFKAFIFLVLGLFVIATIVRLIMS